VRIANHTGHVVRFTRTIFQLTDNTGRRWAPFASTEEFFSWNEADFPPAIATNPQVRSRLRSAVSSLQVLSRSTELLNGDEWSGYLVFNTTQTREYEEFMSTIERLTLRLAEVPIETNQAGEVSRTTEFSFHFDKAVLQRPVICPGGSTPSWSACEEDRGGNANIGSGSTTDPSSSGGTSSAPSPSVGPAPQPGRPLVLAGAITGGTLYGLSFLYGVLVVAVGYPGGLLFSLPVLGPFIAIPVLGSRDAGAGILVLDGLLQAGSVGLLAGGIVMNNNARPRTQGRSRTPGALASWAVAPVAQPHMQGLAFQALTF
jgi:hypothetical protein